ncbi:receptor-like protein 12-like protein [Corchorus olitorius]|uniref:Receptor-like protein 12-like protein n=1 Tax=Corchorus olitorius TaxID=93759 RepID=A0A1R3KB13_9ROSI|nr:receptor-like protein 12-like protein [Corchorus olitorius]
MKGQEMELLSIFTMLTTIDLSNNKFQGEIPLVIGELSSLKGLNLSHNNLSGRIPSSMGDLVSLEWLDLSSNKLVGTIPERLVDVTSLSFLNLSENHLHGQIPQGKQFNTFGNDSYQGNMGLCGFPVSKGCSNNNVPPPPNLPEEYDVSESSITFGWKVVAIGYGCGLVFGLAVGYVVFQTGKPKWFVTLVEEQQHRRRKKPKIGNHSGVRRRIYKSVQKFGP